MSDDYRKCVGALATLATQLSESLIMYESLLEFIADSDPSNHEVQTRMAAQVRRIHMAKLSAYEASAKIRKTVLPDDGFQTSSAMIMCEIQKIDNSAKAALLAAIADSLGVA